MRVLCQQNECPICRRINQKVTSMSAFEINANESNRFFFNLIGNLGNFHIRNTPVS